MPQGGKTSARARARGMMRDRRLSLTEATRQIRRSYPRFPKRVGGKGRTQDLFWARWFHYLRSLDLDWPGTGMFLLDQEPTLGGGVAGAHGRPRS